MNTNNGLVPKRSAKAEATRLAILKSARKAFADFGYDGAGLRGIAEGAGVTAMMINRYFGSKEGLFAEVVADSMADPVILTPANIAASDRVDALAKALVKATAPDNNPLDGFLILFRSSTSPLAADIARGQIANAHHATASALVAGDHASERAALFLSLVAGVQMMRQMMRLEPLTNADPDVLAKLLAPAIGAFLGDGSCTK